MNINGLLKVGEGSTVEFKSEFPGKHQVLATIVAFANTAGGELLIGVDNEALIVGVSSIEAREYEAKLSSWVAQLIEPSVVPIVRTVRIDDKLVASVSVERGYQQPYYLVNKGMEQGTFIRIGASTRLANASNLESMRLRSKNTSFDVQPCQGTTVSDLSRSQINLYLERRKAVRDIPPPQRVDARWLGKMRFVTRVGGGSVPTNAGIFLFADDPGEHLPQYGLELARFRGTDPKDFIDKRSAKGPITHLYEDGLLFFKNHIMRRAVRQPTSRHEMYAYPLDSFREFLLNALCHRDYGTGTGPVRVAIFEDIIEITNPGALPLGLDLSDLGTGVSVLRNPVIGRVFEEMGLIEGWGTGIRIAQSALATASLPLAGITQRGHFTQVSSKWRWPADLRQDDEVILKMAAKQGEIDSQSVAKTLGCTDRTARTKLQNLVKQGLMVKRGATKGTTYTLQS